MEKVWKSAAGDLQRQTASPSNDRVRIFEWLDPAFVGRWRASAWGETERTSQSHRSDTELVRAAVVRTEDLLRNGAGSHVIVQRSEHPVARYAGIRGHSHPAHLQLGKCRRRHHSARSLAQR